MSGHNMPSDVEARIRSLPGNTTCADCENIRPEWASVTYGTLVCLECSGQHRSLGVHLSFVRSVQMDSWTEKQIRAMEQSGGNGSLVEFFKSRGIAKTVQIATKYNTKQAEYYRERLSRKLEGKTEPPPDPGRYDPATGGSDAQGAEPLPGESTDEYNARQARLREQARERLRQKFGGGGMGGIGSSGGSPQPSRDDGLNLGGFVGGAVSGVGGAVSGVGSFFKNKVIDNTELHSKLGATVGSVTDTASGAWSSLRQTYAEGELGSSLKRNVTLQDGSTASKGLGWTLGTVGSLWEKASSGIGDVISDSQSYDQAPVTSSAPHCDKGHPLRIDINAAMKCTLCNNRGTRYSCSRGCEYDICTKCYEDPQGGGASGDAAPAAPPPPEPTNEDMDRMAKELGMSLGPTGPSSRASPAASASPTKGGGPSPGSPFSPPDRNANATTVSRPTGPTRSAQEPSPAKALDVDLAAPAPKPKAKAKALPKDDDFFAEFGL